MNLLLFESGEVGADGVAALAADDPRARHVREVLHAAPGQVLRAGVADGPTGAAEVLDDGAEGMRLRCAWDGGIPERPRVDLALAMPRPKVMNRLWPVIAAMGVGRIWVVNAWKTERVYFDTHVLRPENIRAGLLEGLRQARDTRVPEVRVVGAFKPLLEDELPLDAYAAKLVAHPGAEGTEWRGALSAVAPEGRVLLAVGPEGGWTRYELSRFKAAGFLAMSLGRRILRTDTAVVALLAQIDLTLNR